MKKTLVWVLLAANVALAGTLAWRGVESNKANAQATPMRGKYVMIPGDSSASSAVIYMFDAANGRIGAVAPDNKNVLVSMPTIDIRPVFEAALNGQTPAAGNNGRNATPTNNGNRNNNRR